MRGDSAFFLRNSVATRPRLTERNGRQKKFWSGSWSALATDGQHVCVVPQRSKKASNIPNAKGDYPMKANQLLTICGIAAALFLSAGSVSAQNDNGGGGGGGARRGGGNFDPAQMQQRFMERMHDELGFTNDTEWNAVQPLFKK
jgi:hypothetical protein